MATQVDLLVPGLFHLPAIEFDQRSIDGAFPAFDKLLRYGHQLNNSYYDLDTMLVDCLGFESASNMPYASAVVKDEDVDQQSVILFRAAHLKPDLRNAFVMPLDENTETEKDIFKLINDLKYEFEPDCDVRYLDDGVWLMQLKACQPPSHYPHYLSIVGRKVDQYIERSRAALSWYRLINEMQMFLHTHPVNQQRQVRGLLSINTLWCWGAGSFQRPKRQNRIWYCDEALLQCYAKEAGILSQPVDNVRLSAFIEDTLIVDLSLLQSLKSPDNHSIGTLLQRLEQQVFVPLLMAIKKGRVSLRLRTGQDFNLLITRTSLLKFWRRSTNLIDWLG